MSKKKLHPAAKELLEATTPHQGSRRLGYGASAGAVDVTYEILAAEFEKLDDRHAAVLDASFFARHDIDQAFLDALAKKHLYITSGVRKELRSWQNNSFNHRALADRIEQAARGPDPKLLLDETLPWEPELRAGRDCYAALLSARKQRARHIVEELQVQLGREPTGEERSHALKVSGTERDLDFLKKAWKDKDKPNLFTDEDIVAAAAAIAVRSGRPTMVLTRDADVFDQFRKLCSLLTAHHQASLFAERFAADPSGFTTKPMPTSSAIEFYFDRDASFLVKKPVKQEEFVDWLLPKEQKVVMLTCLLLIGEPPHLKLTLINYAAELDMVRLLRTKGATCGRSTDRLGPKNCHVVGYPEGIEDPRSWAVVVLDRTEPFLGAPFRMPRLDLVHTLQHRDILTRVGDGAAAPAT